MTEPTEETYKQIRVQQEEFLKRHTAIKNMTKYEREIFEELTTEKQQIYINKHWGRLHYPKRFTLTLIDL